MQNQEAYVYQKALQGILVKFQALDIWYERFYALNALKEFLKEGEGEFIIELEKLFKQLIAEEKNQSVLRYLNTY